MYPVSISPENINVLFPRNKRYNSKVRWTDLNIYFRYHGKLIKRCPTILTKEKSIMDYKELLEMFDSQEWTNEEKDDEISWNLCGFKNLKFFKKYKKPIIRHIYDDPNSEEIHQDLLIFSKENEYGYKPYITEIIVPYRDLTEITLKKSAQIYLKECFHISIPLNKINFLKNISEEDLNKKWEEFKDKKDETSLAEKLGRKQKIIFLEEAAKKLFGDDIKSVIIEGNKTTITYESGEVFIEIKPKLKFIKRKQIKNKK